MSLNNFREEAPEVSNVDVKKYFCNRQSKVKVLAACVLSAAALASPDGSSKSVSKLENVGFNTNDVWVTDELAANQAAARVARSGATQIRVIMPYTQGGAEIKNDLVRTCNAAKAAYANDLDLIITMQGYFRSTRKGIGGRGYMPTSSSEKRKYVTAISNLMWSLAGDKNPDGSGGCLPEQKKLTIGFFNEPNNEGFNVNQETAPEDTVNLMSYSYPLLKKEAARDGLGVELTLVGGDVSTSKSSNAVGFIRQMGRYIKERRIKGRLMDKFASHYYLQGADSSPGVSAAENIDRIKKAVAGSFGPEVPVIYDEVGAWSETPPHKEKLYKQPLPSTIQPIGGIEQGMFYKQFIKTAACKGIESVLIFHEKDDGAGVYRTGTSFPNGSDKPSKPIVEKAFVEATTGIKDC